MSAGATRPEGAAPTRPEGTAVRELFVYLCVRDAAAAIDFYGRVFGARETFRLTDRGGRVGHADLELGPATVMLCDEHPEHGILAPAPAGSHSPDATGGVTPDAAGEAAPAPAGGTGVTIHLHVDDVDRLAERAAAAGAVILREPTDYAHGERQCRLLDPFGHTWLLGHQLEELSPEEITRRYEAESGSP